MIYKPWVSFIHFISYNRIQGKMIVTSISWWTGRLFPRCSIVDPGVEHSSVIKIVQDWLTQFELTTCTKDPDIFLDFLASDGNWRDIIAYTHDLRIVTATGISEGQAMGVTGEYYPVLVLALLIIAFSKGIIWKSSIRVIQRSQRHSHPPTSLSRSLLYRDPLPLASPNLFNLCKETSGMLIHYSPFTKASGAYWRAARIEFERRGRTSEKGRVNLSIPIRRWAYLFYLYVHSHSNDSADNWCLRYKSLSLHGPVWANHLAYFPPNLCLLL